MAKCLARLTGRRGRPSSIRLGGGEAGKCRRVMHGGLGGAVGPVAPTRDAPQGSIWRGSMAICAAGRGVPMGTVARPCCMAFMSCSLGYWPATQ